MNQIYQQLLQLQLLETNPAKGPDTEKQIAELSAQIPPMILAHYARLRAKGKKGLAAVNNQVCTGCHMQVPRATVIRLMGGEDLEICDNCSRYLYWTQPAQPSSPNPATAKKAAAKTRARREMAKAE